MEWRSRLTYLPPQGKTAAVVVTYVMPPKIPANTSRLRFETLVVHAGRQVDPAVHLFTRATSLGGVESLIEHRASIEGEGSTTPQGLLRVSTR